MSRMIAHVLEKVGGMIVSVIESLDYSGIVLLMAVESACIPLPSEIIMPFSGYLVSMGAFTLMGVSLAGSAGCVVGSIAAYYVGMKGGRPMVEAYGRYVLISRRDLERADRWFGRWGDATVFFARLLPVIRTFIAFPAGVARMNFLRFVIYTFLGSFPWCLGLAYAGYLLGANWGSLRGWFHRLDFVIAGCVLLGAIWYVWRHMREGEAA